MTSGGQARCPSHGLDCVLMSRWIPGSDHLSQRVLRPGRGITLRGGKWPYCTSNRAIKALPFTSFVPPVIEIMFNAMNSEMATLRASIPTTSRPTPSKRRPVSVKYFFLFSSFPFFFLSPSCPHSAKPPLSPSFHTDSFVTDFRSVQVGVSSIQQVLPPDNRPLFPPSEWNWARSWSQSLDLGGRARQFAPQNVERT